MSLVQVRQEIDEKLDTLDAEMLKAIHVLLYGPTVSIKEPQDNIVGYETDGTPIQKDTLITQINEIDRQVEAGETKLIPAEKVFEKAEKWLKASK